MDRCIAFFFLLMVGLSMEIRLFNEKNEAQAVVGEIQKIDFLEDQIFFIEKSHLHFGYISRKDGKVTRILSLRDGERILDSGRQLYLPLINEKNVILEYNVTAKKSVKNTQFKDTKMDRIIHLARSPQGLYLLIQNELRYYRMGPNMDQKKFTSVIKKEKNVETYIKVFYFFGKQNQKTILTTILEKEERQLCLKEFKVTKLSNERCFSINQKGIPDAVRKSDILYISFSNITYVFNSQLILQKKIYDNQIHFNEDSIVLDDGTEQIHRSIIYKFKKTESNGLENVEIYQQKQMFVIRESGQLIGRIERKQIFEPYKAWIKKNDKNQSYELIIQSKNMVLSSFILHPKNRNSQENAVWTRQNKHI